MPLLAREEGCREKKRNLLNSRSLRTFLPNSTLFWGEVVRRRKKNISAVLSLFLSQSAPHLTLLSITCRISLYCILPFSLFFLVSLFSIFFFSFRVFFFSILEAAWLCKISHKITTTNLRKSLHPLNCDGNSRSIVPVEVLNWYWHWHSPRGAFLLLALVVPAGIYWWLRAAQCFSFFCFFSCCKRLSDWKIRLHVHPFFKILYWPFSTTPPLPKRRTRKAAFQASFWSHFDGIQTSIRTSYWKK